MGVMAELPSGTVSLLFSDVEGSTLLLSRLGPAYADALDGLRQVQRRAWADYGGTELGTEGDSFMVVFPTAEGAMRAAVQAQRELAAFEWPGGEQVRVRMGIHTGTPTVHGDGYVGMDVHRAARIAGSAHGGQVLVSEATSKLVAECLPQQVTLKDLGSHQLKNIASLQHLFQLTVEGLGSDFPPPKTLGTTSSLPRPATPLVGRDGELAEMTALLASPDVRLVTLTGPGGSGKTRLAIAVAERIMNRFPDGVYFVPLAAATTSDVMWTSIAEVLDVPPEGRIPPGFFEHVAHRTALFVLDNLEQVAGADTVVAELMDHGPQVVVIATSRRPLNVPGERQHAVPPLELPDTASMEEVERSGAVQMFVQRATAVKASFTLTTANAADVAEVCRRLDGLPLAIELAAARTKLLSPAALLSRMDKALDIAAAGSRGPSRQKTLRDTVAWSYNLLDPSQRAFFRCLGVFAGGADLDAVAAITNDILDGADPLDLLAELVDASLVLITEASDREPRIGMLETIRAFALDQLTVAGELDLVRKLHAEHFLGVARTHVARVRTDGALSSRPKLLLETNNFRAALTWTLQAEACSPPPPQQARIGLQLCAELSLFWDWYTYVPEFNRWCERAMDIGTASNSREWALVLISVATRSNAPPGDPRALALLEESLSISRGINDLAVTSLGLALLAERQAQVGDLSIAEGLAQESVALARQTNDSTQLSLSMHVQGQVAMAGGDPEAALELFEESQDLDREKGDEYGVVFGDIAIAEALATAGRGVEAAGRLENIVTFVSKSGNPGMGISILATYAHVFAVLGDAERAARMLAAHWAQWADTGSPVDPESQEEQAWLEKTGIAAARKTLGEQRWQNALRIGRDYTLQQALADARQPAASNDDAPN